MEKKRKKHGIESRRMAGATISGADWGRGAQAAKPKKAEKNFDACHYSAAGAVRKSAGSAHLISALKKNSFVHLDLGP
ncbi:hypothetical protein R1flu_017786 [Riccia fluitans]|uniref:Uncharacterized protein n=1 Tax=Riccia fluitans TaxID=41844 RepID=A0ABD1ZDZ3_9MARC